MRSSDLVKVFYVQRNGDIAAEERTSGFVRALGLNRIPEWLSPNNRSQTYALSIDKDASFSGVFEVFDKAKNGRFDLRIDVQCSASNQPEAHRRLVASRHAKTSLDEWARVAIQSELDALGSHDENQSLLQTLLSAPAAVEMGIRNRLSMGGLSVSQVTTAPIDPFGAIQRTIEQQDPISVRAVGTETMAALTYRVDIVADPQHTARRYFARAVRDRGVAAIDSRVHRLIKDHLNLRYRLQEYVETESLAQIEADLKRALDETLIAEFGIRTNRVEVYSRSPTIDDVFFDFEHAYRILGTKRTLVIEHRGCIRCIELGKLSTRSPEQIEKTIQTWIINATTNYLSDKTLADIVVLFCENEEDEENRLRDYLTEEVGEKTKKIGLLVKPIIAISQNIAERDLVFGRKIEVPLHQYALNHPNSSTELEVFITAKLDDARKLRPYVRDDGIEEEVIKRVRSIITRNLQNVPLDVFYKSTIANHGGDSELSKQWQTDFDDDLKEAMGLTVTSIEFGRGRDPVRERFAHLVASPTQTVTFEKRLSNEQGGEKSLSFVIQYHILGAVSESWERFQNKALSHIGETGLDDQINEISARLVTFVHARLQQWPSADHWQAIALNTDARDSLRSSMADTVAQEYGIAIEIPADGILCMDAEPETDPIIAALLDSRDRIELEIVELLQAPGGDDELFSGGDDALAQKRAAVEKLTEEIDRRRRTRTDRQLESMRHEDERNRQLSSAVEISRTRDSITGTQTLRLTSPRRQNDDD